MLPKTTIIIDKNGNSRIIGEEKSDQCFKLTELAKEAGKITNEKEKEHVPVYQTVNRV